ncbi:MAG: ABC transporter substrate-binding protein [bacterium]|nr:ABC transporter substrate-binding protein [bacterium]
MQSAAIVSAAVAIVLAATTTTSLGAQSVTVGVVGPLTGDFAVVGISQVNGAKLKVAQLAKTDLGVNIHLVPEDDASKCDQSVNATTKLVEQERADAILGAGNSPCALAMVPITARDEVPQFTVGIGAAITQQGSKYVFRVAPSAAVQTQALANFAVGKLHLKKIAILYTNDEYGKSAGEAMRAALKAKGLEPSVFEAWTIGDKDFSGQLSKVKSSGADALFATGSVADAALIARQARQMGLTVRLLGDTGTANDTYIKLGGSAVEGAVVAFPFDPRSNEPAVRDFVRTYQATYGRLPNSWDAEMYDAVGMIHAAVKHTGKTDGKSIRDYIASLRRSSGYRGVMGDIYFDANGDAQFALNMARIKNGQFVDIGR